jgi:exonuclease VII large subunit
MSAVESVLEAQTTALLRRLAREQETRTRRIRDEAEAQAADVVRRARSEARSRVRQAVLETRRADETTLARRRAALDTQARRSQQAILRELLDRAWQALPDALLSRWQDQASRKRWCAAACTAARRSLRHMDRLQVELDPQWVPELGAALVQSFTGDSTVNVAAIDALGAGLRIRAGDACLDATVAGLLAARERIAAELLAEFERQGAAHGAERQP